MRSTSLLLVLCLIGAITLEAQSFQKAFFPPSVPGTSPGIAQAQNYGATGRLASSISIGYEEGLSLKEELGAEVIDQSISLQLTKSKDPLILQATFQAQDIDRYHLLLTTKKGAFLENFPLNPLTQIDCRRLRDGAYKIQLCARDQAKPLRQFKLVKY